MNTYQLSIKETDDLSWAIQAAHDLAGATEKDLATLKTKKWYHRILDVVTFSQGSKIQTLKNIETLAKLQEIVARVLVMLSQQNAEISSALRDQSDLLKNLQCQDMALLKAIRKIKYGGTDQLDFGALDPDKKELLANLLLMVDPDAERNNHSRRYITSILSISNSALLDNTYQIDAVDMLNKKEQELLYQMIMIDRYLRDIDFDEDSDIVDNIGISKKRAREIQSAIKTTAANVVPDFFVTYYERVADSINAITDDDITFFHETGTQNDAKAHTPDEADTGTCKPDKIGARFTTSAIECLDMIYIPNVQPNETWVCENKVIHITGDNRCRGTMKFINCIIRYDEKKEVGSFIVEYGGDLQFERCSFMGRSHDNNQYIIKVEGNSKETRFIDCYFWNCINFMNTSSGVVFDHCTINSLGSNFICRSWSSKVVVNIENCSFSNQSAFEFAMPVSETKEGNAISCHSIHIINSSFCGELFLDSAEKSAKILTEANGWSMVRETYSLDAETIVIKDSNFVGLMDILRGSEYRISNTTFSHCANIFTGMFGYTSDTNIQDCSFDHCTKIADDISGKWNWYDCAFKNCYNNLINTGFSSVTRIESCSFIHWCACSEQNYNNHSMLTFSRSKNREYGAHCIQNCKFTSLEANQAFVIKGSILDNISGYVATVASCTFTDCNTKRNSRKLIKEYDYYLGFMKREIEKKVIDVDYNCTGWNNI